jgi:uncharacterized membrane protein
MDLSICIFFAFILLSRFVFFAFILFFLLFAWKKSKIKAKKTKQKKKANRKSEINAKKMHMDKSIFFPLFFPF